MRVIATAGHVDHGKSTLVQALTGTDPDRLEEEQRRGLTIVLGFAWMDLAMPDGTLEPVSIVDVPGHIDFIKNMLAGVGSIDAAVLVIAADEGVMPQTREHLAILDLLALPEGLVALTKTDLIDDPEWLELIELDIQEILVGTRLEGAPIVPVSAQDGEGLEQLRSALASALTALPPRRDRGRPRLPIDRIFSLPGFWHNRNRHAERWASCRGRAGGYSSRRAFRTRARPANAQAGNRTRLAGQPRRRQS